MARRDIFVIGASAGGVEALKELVGNLPGDFPATILIVLHVPSSGPSVLPAILTKAGALEALHPADGDPILRGRIYIAPPDHHLLVERNQIRLARGPKENHHRPAIDPLFRSAARAYASRVTGVVLTGFLDDGTAGLQAIKERGGLSVVQDPRDAVYAGMPRSALEKVEVDYCLPLSEIAPLLARLAGETVEEEEFRPLPEDIDTETGIAIMENADLKHVSKLGKPSVFSCPDCRGTLWELSEGNLLRFRCQVGHAFSSESLESGQSEAIETALWVALRALEENVAFSRRLAKRARACNHEFAARRYDERVRDLSAQSDVIRRMLLKDRVIQEEVKA